MFVFVTATSTVTGPADTETALKNKHKMNKPINRKTIPTAFPNCQRVRFVER